MHMVAARLGFEKAMVGTQRATPRSDCMDRLRKHYSHLAEGWSWLVPRGQPHALTAWTGLENTTLTLQRAGHGWYPEGNPTL